MRFLREIKLIIFIVMLFETSLGQTGTKLDRNKPIEITSDNLEVNQDNNTGFFWGNVIATQGDVKLQSNEMTVYYDNKNKSSINSITKVLVKGNVVARKDNQTAKGDEGIYYVTTQLLELYGKVSLSQGENIVKGNKLIYNLQTGKSTIVSNKEGSQSGEEGRVKAIFTPNKK